MKTKSKKTSPAKPIPETDWLGIIEDLRLTITPGVAGGWSAWTEVEGRENQVNIIRGHKPTLREVLLDMDRRLNADKWSPV